MEIALVSAAAALVGVVVGELIAWNRQRDLIRQERLNAQREMLVEVLDSAERWLGPHEILIASIGRMKTSDLMEFVNTDTGPDMAANDRRLRLALIRARLFVEDDECRSVLDRASMFVDGYAATVSQPIIDSKGGAAHIAEGVAKQTAFRALLKELEGAAVAIT